MPSGFSRQQTHLTRRMSISDNSDSDGSSSHSSHHSKSTTTREDLNDKVSDDTLSTMKTFLRQNAINRKFRVNVLQFMGRMDKAMAAVTRALETRSSRAGRDVLAFEGVDITVKDEEGLRDLEKVLNTQPLKLTELVKFLTHFISPGNPGSGASNIMRDEVAQGLVWDGRRKAIPNEANKVALKKSYPKITQTIGDALVKGYGPSFPREFLEQRAKRWLTKAKRRLSEAAEASVEEGEL